MGSVLGNVAGTGLKVFTAGATAAAAGISALGTASISAFADTEQLVGGIETMFEDLSWDVEEYAKKAYKTAGLSANAYMETVMGFSASLNQSLLASEGNIARAADLSNQIIIDMSDNANKMGTGMESIQNAYQGFAKQNYTMLDNLKLGYGGTKEEMQRLLEDAEKLSGIKYDISSFADIAEAIHVVQTEMGITGTTAQEASSTIVGSLSATKAAWTNLVAGMADENQDIGVLVDNLVDSSLTVVDNLLPRVEIVLGGMGQMIEELLPIIVEKIPPILSSILPDIMQAGVDVVIMFLKGIEDNFPDIIRTGSDALFVFIDGIAEIIPVLGEIAYDIITKLLTSIYDHDDEVLRCGSEALLSFIQGICDKLPDLIITAANAVVSMAVAMTKPETLRNMVDAALQLILALVHGLLEAIPRLLLAVIAIVVQIGVYLVQEVGRLLSPITDFFGFIVDAFMSLDWASIGSNILDGIWNGISAGWDWLVNSVKSLASSLFGAAKDELDINSPSRKFKWLGEMCVAGWDEGTEDLFDADTVKKDINATLSVAKAGVVGANGGIGGGGFTQHIYVNKEVSTPDEVARAIRVESRYGLMGGVAFA